MIDYFHQLCHKIGKVVSEPSIIGEADANTQVDGKYVCTVKRKPSARMSKLGVAPQVLQGIVNH